MWPALLCSAAAAIALGELAIVRRGYANVPLYRHGKVPGHYRTLENQVGVIGRKVRWEYDENGMRHSGPPVSLAGSIILVGDSVVEGGLRIDQSETLAAILSAARDACVYPLACQGWSLANELAALEALPGWDEAGQIIVMINPGDLDAIGLGLDRFSFPVRRPRWKLGWLVQRTLTRRLSALFAGPEALANRAPDARQREQNALHFGRLMSRFPGRLTILFVPLRDDELGDETFAYCRRLAALRAETELIDLRAQGGWGKNCYADRIHPSREGIVRLAAILS